jgi:DNA processing protein
LWKRPSCFKESKINLLKIKGIGAFHLQGFNKFERCFSTVLEEEKFLKKEKIIPILYNSCDYPKTLAFFANAPLVLFQKGEVSWKNEHIVSIVGTRNPTSRGIDFCKQLINELAVYHPIIVSGFAKGIDLVAYNTALENHIETVACLGHGLNQIYPKEHHSYV